MHLAQGVMNRFRRLTGPNSYETELGASLSELLPQGGTWLDLGCGSAVAVRELARLRPDALIWACDLLPGLNDGLQLPPNLLLFQADAVCLPLTGSFDLITAVHVLHFLDDKQAALGAWAALGKPGCQLLANYDPSDVWVGADWEHAQPLPGAPAVLHQPVHWGKLIGNRPAASVNQCGVQSMQSLYDPLD